MPTALPLDLDAIARACGRYGVARLRVFGSLVTGDFDRDRSDIDFLVDYAPGSTHTIGLYLDLKAELESVTGRQVDLVETGAMRNPYFAQRANTEAVEVSAS